MTDYNALTRSQRHRLRKHGTSIPRKPMSRAPKTIEHKARIGASQRLCWSLRRGVP